MQWIIKYNLTCKFYAAAAAKSLQLCPTLCDPIDGSPPGPAVPGILQARTLEWVAISFSNAWKWKVKVKSLSRVRLSATSWTAAHQAPPSMGSSRQEYWSGVPLPSPKTCSRAIHLIGINYEVFWWLASKMCSAGHTLLQFEYRVSSVSLCFLNIQSFIWGQSSFLVSSAHICIN